MRELNLLVLPTCANVSQLAPSVTGVCRLAKWRVSLPLPICLSFTCQGFWQAFYSSLSHIFKHGCTARYLKQTKSKNSENAFSGFLFDGKHGVLVAFPLYTCPLTIPFWWVDPEFKLCPLVTGLCRWITVIFGFSPCLRAKLLPSLLPGIIYINNPYLHLCSILVSMSLKCNLLEEPPNDTPIH